MSSVNFIMLVDFFFRSLILFELVFILLFSDHSSDFLLFYLAVLLYKLFNKISFLSFQLPAFLSQVKEALGLPAAPTQDVPVAGPSSSAPPISAPVAGVSSSAPPPIVVENSESEDDVQTLAVPFRSGSSEAFLPMVSTDESWSTDVEIRFVF